MSRYFQFCIIGLICFNFVISAVFVNTRLGRIQGLLLSSRNGKKFGAFMGVPYAQPPVGNLRLEVSGFQNSNFSYFSSLL